MIDNRKVIKGLSSQTIVTIVMGVLSILTFSIFTRLLSQEIFGYFASLNAILFIFQSFSQAGLGSAVIQKKDCSEEYFSTAFTLSVIISVLFAVVLFFTSAPLARLVADDTITNPLRILSVLLVLGSVESVGRAALMRKLQFMRYGLYQIISYVISYAIGIYLAFKGAGLYSLVIAAILNNILICGFIYLLSVRIPRLVIYRSDAKSMFSFGGWLTASVLVNQSTQQLDKLVLGKWLSISALGAYSRPATFVSTISDRINGIFDTVLFPILSSYQDDTAKIKEVYQKSIVLLNIFSTALASIFFFNAELIIKIFFGHDWLSLVPVLRIIAVGVIFMVDQRLVDCFFRSLSLVKENFFLRLICMVIMLIALYIGARHGIIATAISVVVANLISILIKISYLTIKIDVQLRDVLNSFAISIKPMLPIFVAGVIYLICFDTTMTLTNILWAIIMFAMFVVEFFVFPRFVSEDYYNMVRPYLGKFLK